MATMCEMLREMLAVATDLQTEGVEVMGAYVTGATPALHVFHPPAAITARGTKADTGDAEVDRHFYTDRDVEVFWLVPKPAAQQL